MVGIYTWYLVLYYTFMICRRCVFFSSYSVLLCFWCLLRALCFALASIQVASINSVARAQGAHIRSNEDRGVGGVMYCGACWFQWGNPYTQKRLKNSTHSCVSVKVGAGDFRAHKCICARRLRPKPCAGVTHIAPWRPCF